jgi:L-asparaginase II
MVVETGTVSTYLASAADLTLNVICCSFSSDVEAAALASAIEAKRRTPLRGWETCNANIRYERLI